MSWRVLLVACLLAAVQARSPYENTGFGPRALFAQKPSSGRIVGGKDARKAEFPHIVSLQWGLPPILNASHFCAGAIIKPDWILTAAHCVDAIPHFGDFLVKAGKHLVKLVEKGEQVVAVAESLLHDVFPGQTMLHDIALLKLEKPLKFNAGVSPIQLPKANSEPSGAVTLAGWGSISAKNLRSLPDALQKADLSIVDLATCNKSIEKLTGEVLVDKTNVCTGPMTGGISACAGDSGGPLIGRGKNGRAEIVGITSWGIYPCGQLGAPTVYTKVSAYIDWINAVMTGDYKSS